METRLITPGYVIMAEERQRLEAEIERLRAALYDCRAWIRGDVSGSYQLGALEKEINELLGPI